MHHELQVWDNLANRRGLTADDLPSLMLGIGAMLDDRLRRPVFVWLTPIDYTGELQPKQAFAVDRIVTVAPGVEQSWEDWSDKREPVDIDRTLPTIRHYTPGASVEIAGAGEGGSSWLRNVVEQPEQVVLLCEGDR